MTGPTRAGPTAWTPPLLLTTLCFLVLSLGITAEWTYCARTEQPLTQPGRVLAWDEGVSTCFCSLVGMAEGKTCAPFVKRRLLPDLARGLRAAVPAWAWARFGEWVEGDGSGAAWARAQFRRLFWTPANRPLMLCGTALIYLSVVGFLFTCRWLTRLLYEDPGWVADVVGAVLGVALLGGNTDWHYGAYPYDFPNAFVFTLALAALLARRWWFVLAFAAAAYSKETSVLLLVAYALLAEDRRSVSFWARLGLLAAVYAGVRGWIELQYPVPAGEFWFPGRNWRYLTILLFYGWSFPLLGVSLVRLVAARRLYPPALKKLCLLAVPLLGLAYFKGWIEELRQYLEVLPILGLIVLQWVLHEAWAGHLLRARAPRAGRLGAAAEATSKPLQEAA